VIGLSLATRPILQYGVAKCEKGFGRGFVPIASLPARGSATSRIRESLESLFWAILWIRYESLAAQIGCHDRVAAYQSGSNQ
jgi:hypothetical protein